MILIDEKINTESMDDCVTYGDLIRIRSFEQDQYFLIAQVYSGVAVLFEVYPSDFLNRYSNSFRVDNWSKFTILELKGLLTRTFGKIDEIEKLSYSIKIEIND